MHCQVSNQAHGRENVIGVPATVCHSVCCYYSTACSKRMMPNSQRPTANSRQTIPDSASEVPGCIQSAPTTPPAVPHLAAASSPHHIYPQTLRSTIDNIRIAPTTVSWPFPHIRFQRRIACVDVILGAVEKSPFASQGSLREPLRHLIAPYRLRTRDLPACDPCPAPTVKGPLRQHTRASSLCA